MSKADELIAGLQTDGEFDSDGSFSLDREKARQKMRQFQLADPHRYVLLLVEAASLRGASEIEFEIDTDDMHMRFDAALAWADLDELYTSLFVDRTTVAIRARRELALACNAAMALNPRWIRIDSFARDGDQITGIRAVLRPEEQDLIDRVEAPSGASAPYTTIHVKERFRPGLLVRFLHNLGDALAETELLRERCAMASIRITLDGLPISFGLPRDLIAAVEFESEGLRGVAGLNLGALDRSAMVLMSNGVEISTTELNESVPGLWFWVDSSEFRKDVSQAAIVRSDPSYELMLHAVARARDRVLGRLVALWSSGEFDENRKLPSARLFDLLRECFLRWADVHWLHDDAGSLGSLADLPLWRTVDRRWVSPRALQAEADPERGIMYTHRDFDGVQPLGWGPVLAAVDGLVELDAIKRVYPESRDVSDELEREVPWELNRRRWRSRPHPAALPRGAEAGAATRTIDIAHAGYVGQVVARATQRTDIRIIVDGCLLCDLEFDLGTIGLSAVLSGPFTPTGDYATLEPDRALASGAMLLLAQVPILLAELADRGGPRDVLRWSLLALCRPNFAAEWLEAFGFETKAAAQMVARLGKPNLLPSFGLGVGKSSAVARMLTFETADEREVSVAMIDGVRRKQTRERGKVLFVDTSAPATAGLPELILRVSLPERQLLTAIFGPEQLHDDSELYRRELGRRTFLAGPNVEPSLENVTWRAEVANADEQMRAIVGIDAAELRDWQSEEPRTATIELIVEQRRLTRLEERAWVPGVVASVAWELAPVNPTWTGLDGSRRPLNLGPLHAAINDGVIEILEKLAREAVSSGRRPDPAARRLLWLAMAAPFISTEHAAAWRRIRAELEFGPAVETYLGVLLLFPWVTLGDMRETLELLLEDDRLPTRTAVLEILGRPEPSWTGGREFQRAVLERYELLEQVPLIELTSGKAIGLDELVSVYAATDEIAHVRDLTLHYEHDEYRIIRTDQIDHVALLRLFGRDAFKEVSAWIHERRHQDQFETQVPLEQIRVKDHSRLVGVELEHDGITGELAIPPWTPSETGVMKLVFCHQRRIVEELELHAKQPVIGIVDDPEAPLSSDFRRVDQTSSRMATIRKLLDEVLSERLLPALAEAYPSLDPRGQSVAREWIIDHWRRTSPRAGQHPNRLSEAGRRFAELPLFVDIDETPRSLAELSERYREQRKLWYVESAPRYRVAPPFPILWCRPHERELIDELFADCEDFSARWRARVDGERRRERAPDLPGCEAPANALVVAEVSRHGLAGALWLPDRVPFDSGVILGSRAKVVTVRDLVEMLPVTGVVDGVETDDGFESPELSGPQTRYLEARAIYVYAELLNHHHRDLRSPERPTFSEPEQVRLRGLRIRLLRRAATELARARRRGVGMDAIVRNLERRLEHEPLLELASGRLISVDVARKARPPELAHLDVWDPTGPQLDPDERARLLLGESVEEVAAAEVVESGRGEAAGPPAEAPPAPAEPLEVVEPINLEFLDDEGEVVAPEQPTRDVVGEVLERVRGELRLLRERHEIVLQEGHLDCIAADVRNGRVLVRIDDGIVFDSTHPRFERAMIDPDPIWVSFLASVAYTAVNTWLTEVTDADELIFHRRHAEHLLSGLLGDA